MVIAIGDVTGGASFSEKVVSLSTRIGGGQKNQPDEASRVRCSWPRVRTRLTTSQVIVDMREFRSSLPNLLDKARMQVLAATLTVGDYVLSPEICVERKSIPDLLQSFNSGRL